MKKIIPILLILFLVCSNAYAQEIPESAYGVITIPALDLEMPIYAVTINDHDHRQAVIDEDFSALVTAWGSATQILDHIGSTGTSGEWYIQKIYPGAYAYLYTQEDKYYYECYMAAKTEYDGNEYINGRLITPCSSLDLMLVCCAEDTDHHFVATFRRVIEF